MEYAKVSLDIGVFNAYTYKIPKKLQASITVGSFIAVPFGKNNRIQYGFCIELTREPVKGVKDIIKAVYERPLITEKFLCIAKWISEYYVCPLGEVLASIIPAGVKRNISPNVPVAYVLAHEYESVSRQAKKQRKIIEYLKSKTGPVPKENILSNVGCSASVLRCLEKKGFLEKKIIFRDIDISVELKGADVIELTQEQKTALKQKEDIIEQDAFKVVLLKGVTGSGKTELYLRAIEKVVASGRAAIMLVPEIVLTPQISARFGSRFKRVAVMHSKLSDGERAAIWKGIKEGEYDIVIGPRSALFSPFRNLGLIIVDEEHENTYKQGSNPRYHARDLAVYIGKQYNIPVILGSATPSIESFSNTQAGKYTLITLSKRVGGYEMPEISLINLSREFAEKKIFSRISLPLKLQIEEALRRGEQTIVFINQRGFSRFVFCPLCGKPLKCRNCDITLTYHKKKEQFLCHYCGFSEKEHSTCPVCGYGAMKKAGAGTEKIEEELINLFPDAVIQRMDSDSMSRKSKYRDVLTKFARNEINILVGTQIVAKGLDFPNVTTVGVVGIENILNLPDFRSPERTFQLISQVAGRAGRGRKKGRVMVEVFDSSHYAINCAVKGSYEEFYAIENKLRKELHYPPFGSLVRILIEGADEQKVKAQSWEIKRRLRQGKFPKKIIILGPVPAPLSYINRRFRYHILIKVRARIPVGGLFPEKDIFKSRSGVRVTVDVDPVSML